MKRHWWMKPGSLGCPLAALGVALTLPASGAGPAPTISGYAATNPRGVRIFSAPPGAPLLIEGANLGTSGTVAFSGVPAPPPASWSPTEILVTVPSAPSYPFKGPVTVTTDGQTATGPEFTITTPPGPLSAPPHPAGTWSVISLPHPPKQPGEVLDPRALAADAAGNLYVADAGDGSRIQKRDVQGHWSVMAAFGTALGQVHDHTALAADSAGNLYVADYGNGTGRIQKRDAQGNWTVIATYGTGLGQVSDDIRLAVDNAGNLYVTDENVSAPSVSAGRIQKRGAQGGCCYENSWLSCLGTGNHFHPGWRPAGA